MKKLLLAAVFVLTIPALVFAQTVVVNPQINNPQSNTLDVSGNAPTNNLDASVDNPQTATAAEQTTGDQTQNPPAYEGDLNLQLQAQGQFSKQESNNSPHQNEIEESGACVDHGCQQENDSSNYIGDTDVQVLSNNLAFNVQGNALLVTGFYQGGTPDADADSYASANAAGFAQSSINTANVLSGVGVVNGSVFAQSTGNANAQVSAPSSATSYATSTATKTINVTDNFNDNFSNNTLDLLGL